MASVENRHRIGSGTVPASLGFEAGYLGIPGTLFGNQGSFLGNLYWQQTITAGKTGYPVGRYDPSDFMDLLGYASPWTGFQNLAVMLNTSVALPDWSWGAGVGTFLSDNWYVLGTINDANGTITDTSFFEGGSEFFKQVTIGWTPSSDMRYTNNFHTMLWHVDERDQAGVPESYGITFGGIWKFSPNWLGFTRLGISEGEAPLYNETATVGFGRLVNPEGDVFGIGLNWGSPADKNLRDQLTTELFYNIQLSENLEVTPSLQYIVDPALNLEEDSLTLLSLRMRMTF